MREVGPDVTAMFARMCADLVAWRAAHPDATLDEIAAQVTPGRREVIGALIAGLACQEGDGYALEGLCCERCGERMVYKGTPRREILHLEGEIGIARAYYHCPHCGGGVFPPGPTPGADAP